MMAISLVLIAGLGGFEGDVKADDGKSSKVSLTIYNAPVYDDYYGSPQGGANGYAVVREFRSMELEKGRNTVRFTDVAKTIDGTSVKFESLTDPERTSVVEQSFEYDLVSADKILDRYIDRPLSAFGKEGRIDGALLSYDAGSLVLSTQDEAHPVQIIARGENVHRIAFGELPGGLITKPTLVWDVQAGKGGKHDVSVAYQASSIGWETDYSLVLNEADTQAKVAGWVTIVNQSGATYKDAGLKLVAGDVHRAAPPRQSYPGAGMKSRMADMESSAPQFEEKSFFEYHLYTLQRTTTLAENSVKQIELFTPAQNVPARKILAYYGSTWQSWWGYGSVMTDRNLGIQSNTKVDIYIEIKNKRDNGLGIPLPKGKVRVYKEDPADKSLEFIGEDAIDHTAKDETLLLKLGNAFDVVGERKQTDFKTSGDNIWESFEITLKNHKDKPVTVLVKENLYRWSNWAIEKASHKYEKQDYRTIHVELDAPANGQKTFAYTVHYWW